MQEPFRNSIRAVFFQTAYEECLYATHGGTLFLVRHKGTTFGLTCRHVFKDFGAEGLFVTQHKWGQKGSKPAPISGMIYPSNPRDGAIDSEILDLCVIEFSNDLSTDFFIDKPYPIEIGTVAASKVGDRLEVAGVLKDQSHIELPDITIAFCRLDFTDTDVVKSDAVVREAKAQFSEPEFARVTGISGSPVFNVTQNVLSGMVVRGGMDKEVCTIRYIDIFDILKFLDAISARVSNTYYVKTFSR